MPTRRPDSRQLSPDEQRRKRMTALSMREQGHTYREIAEALGVHQRTVQHWAAVRAKQGDEAAIEGGQRGAESGLGRSLSPEQEIQAQRWVTDQMPDQLKLPFALWTRAAVRELIQAQFGLTLSEPTVSLYLRRWGYATRRPRQRDSESRPAKMRQWLEHKYPAIARRAKEEGATILWGNVQVVRNEAFLGRSYTPLQRIPRASKGVQPYGLKIISATSNRGKQHFMLYRDTLDVTPLLDFLKQLVQHEKRKIFLILDSLRMPNCAQELTWLAKNADKIALFAPSNRTSQRNPDKHLTGNSMPEMHLDLRRQLET